VGSPFSSSLASEFPHDNAEISRGAVWICSEVTGPATAVLGAHEPVPSPPFVLFFGEDDDGYVDGPLELETDEDDGAISARLAAPSPTPPSAVEPEAAAFMRFESALVGALMAQGASRSAALVPRLLRLEPLPADSLGKDVQLTLQSRGYLDSGARYSSKYRELCGAWSAVLRGSSQDFAACGTTTLDRFGAELLAALLAVPATRADELRRELRKAGIAAFGVLQAA
jgi:hypothetical protein